MYLMNDLMDLKFFPLLSVNKIVTHVHKKFMPKCISISGRKTNYKTFRPWKVEHGGNKLFLRK